MGGRQSVAPKSLGLGTLSTLAPPVVPNLCTPCSTPRTTQDVKTIMPRRKADSLRDHHFLSARARPGPTVALETRRHEQRNRKRTSGKELGNHVFTQIALARRLGHPLGPRRFRQIRRHGIRRAPREGPSRPDRAQHGHPTVVGGRSRPSASRRLRGRASRQPVQRRLAERWPGRLPRWRGRREALGTPHERAQRSRPRRTGRPDGLPRYRRWIRRGGLARTAVNRWDSWNRLREQPIANRGKRNATAQLKSVSTSVEPPVAGAAQHPVAWV